MRTVTVCFDGSSRKYEYFIPDWISEVCIGERVIVEAPSSGYETVTVQSYNYNAKSSLAKKSLVAKIDDSQYREVKEKEKRKQEITQKLSKIEASLSERIRFQVLSSFSKEAADLLEELEGLK